MLWSFHNSFQSKTKETFLFNFYDDDIYLKKSFRIQTGGVVHYYKHMSLYFLSFVR